MQKNLVIVESPAKAKTIEKFLGKDFKVMSSYGHIRDLKKKELSIDDTTMEPEYEIPDEKKKLVSDLKKQASQAEKVWLASDEDREGEAISWHLCEVLGLDEEKTNRIVFHEITKPAILEAIEHPRHLDMNLVNAQQARRVLDRLVGFKVSPVLWRMKNHKEVEEFLEACKEAKFVVSGVQKKPMKRTPAPPFTTSTLQQEAARKLGFTVSQTMMVAQRLYESGRITYMRTDSVNLSKLCLGASKEEITKLYGDEYSKPRQYHTSSKGAQEAHEAIRPTYMDQTSVEGTAQEKKLYELIWKRTIASQMADAELEKTTVEIDIDNSDLSFENCQFIANGEVVKFDGFLKLYRESTDDEEQQEETGHILPPMKKGRTYPAPDEEGHGAGSP